MQTDLFPPWTGGLGFAQVPALTGSYGDSTVVDEIVPQLSGHLCNLASSPASFSVAV